MENHQKFNQYIDPQKANQTARELMSTITEVQEIFLYLQTHTNLSIIRSLAIVEQHLLTKEGKNLPDLLKPISEEYPEFKILPIYRSTVNSFSKQFPAVAITEYIKAKVKVWKNRIIANLKTEFS